MSTSFNMSCTGARNRQKSTRTVMPRARSPQQVLDIPECIACDFDHDRRAPRISPGVGLTQFLAAPMLTARCTSKTREEKSNLPQFKESNKIENRSKSWRGVAL